MSNFIVETAIMKFIIKYSVIYLLCLASCQKDSFNSTIIDGENPPSGESRLKKVYGKIISESGNPLANAKIIYRNKNYQTDRDGKFEFEAYISTTKELLKIESDLYYSNYLNVKAYEQGEIVLNTKLSPKNLPTTISANTDITLMTNYSSKLSFIKNNCLMTDSTVYSGDVSCYIHEKVSSAEAYYQLPYDQLGIIDKQKYLLADMPVIELEFKSVKLNSNIILNKPIQIEIKNRKQNALTSYKTFYVWKLNTKTGFWEKKSDAKYENNLLIGSVDGGGIYMISPALNYRTVSGAFTGMKKYEFLNLKVLGTEADYQTYINDLGFWEFNIPESQNFNYALFNDLNQELYMSPKLIASNDIKNLNTDLVKENCISLNFQINSCLSNSLNSNFMIFREKGNSNDQLFDFYNTNLFLKTIKQTKDNYYTIYHFATANQDILRSKMSNYNKLNLLSPNAINVCSEKQGFATLQMIAANNNTNTLHRLPVTITEQIGSDINNCELNIQCIDAFSDLDVATYTFTLKIINGRLFNINAPVITSVVGNPEFIYNLGVNSNSTISFAPVSGSDRIFSFNLANLSIKDQVNNSFTGGLAGYLIID